MNFEEYRLDDAVLCRYDRVYNAYRQMYGDRDHREPKFIAVLPSEYNPVWEERLADPAVMQKVIDFKKAQAEKVLANSYLDK